MYLDSLPKDTSIWMRLTPVSEVVAVDGSALTTRSTVVLRTQPVAPGTETPVGPTGGDSRSPL
ncbi:MAG: hypothetical protein GIKADHBN_03586 [Phycisphaerales bacterium]|nr:hypothetical protein [Phycisphaerales bacterium]